MSSITEQVNKLREFAKLCNDPLICDTQTKICGKLMSDAADTIEMLSAKCRDRWIPTSERLPDEYGEYLITWSTTLSERPFIGIAEYEILDEYDYTSNRFKGEWLLEDYIKQYPNVQVIAWQPLLLPKPYEEDTE